MSYTSEIKIQGRVAEIIDSDAGKSILIVCNSRDVLVSVDNFIDVSLGDNISITGNLKYTALEVNGIEAESLEVKP